MRHRICISGIAAAELFAVLLLPMASRADDSKTVAAGAKWEVPATTAFSELTIGEGATLSAPAGHGLTMTVDGVQVDLQPGNYQGKIVLTVTDDPSKSSGAPAFRAALMIDNGKIVKQSSVLASVAGGQVTDTSASGISITSHGKKFNGVLATGDSKYTLDNPTIDFVGTGSDMDGAGAAVMVTGKADVTLNHAKITTRGLYRNALFVSGNGTLHVNDSDVEAYSGVVPAGSTEGMSIGGGPPGVPWMLGLSGNVRATSLKTAPFTTTTPTSSPRDGARCRLMVPRTSACT